MKLLIILLIASTILTTNLRDLALLDIQLSALHKQLDLMIAEEEVAQISPDLTPEQLHAMTKGWKKQFHGPTPEPELTEADLRDISKIPVTMRPAAIQAILERKRKELEQAVESLD